MGALAVLGVRHPAMKTFRRLSECQVRGNGKNAERDRRVYKWEVSKRLTAARAPTETAAAPTADGPLTPHQSGQRRRRPEREWEEQDNRMDIDDPSLRSPSRSSNPRAAQSRVLQGRAPTRNVARLSPRAGSEKFNPRHATVDAGSWKGDAASTFDSYGNG
ncbi:hypothetical protein GGX14DRAFT_394067 [Mycena pura]|uniref:Uncharacterized protein n=1 Tax=Mycena pura TaxID=153505 RepID=A0AAD6YE75_9AGAR|nr:hypothetical protein GGX14DRAFT_394067 [Mycena pura]